MLNNIPEGTEFILKSMPSKHSFYTERNYEKFMRIIIKPNAPVFPVVGVLMQSNSRLIIMGIGESYEPVMFRNVIVEFFDFDWLIA